MKILLVNDDGIHSPSIIALAKALAEEHDVTVVAPQMQRSAFSHAITMFENLVTKRCDFDGITAYSTSGTPGDCAKLGLKTLCHGAQLIISGINLGWNVGTDIPYSGTIAAASEGVHSGIPAIALSREVEEGYDYAYEGQFMLALLKTLDFSMFQNKILLNINFPTVKPKGVRYTVPANLDYGEYYEEISSNEDTTIFKLHGELKDFGEEGTDAYTVKQGFISITPLGVDRTTHHLFEVISTINL